MVWFRCGCRDAVFPTDVLPALAGLRFRVIALYSQRYSDVTTEILQCGGCLTLLLHSEDLCEVALASSKQLCTCGPLDSRSLREERIRSISFRQPVSVQYWLSGLEMPPHWDPHVVLGQHGGVVHRLLEPLFSNPSKASFHFLCILGCSFPLTCCVVHTKVVFQTVEDIQWVHGELV